jgi:hypothetical protein
MLPVLVAETPARASSSRTIWRMRISDMPPVVTPRPPEAAPEPRPLELPVPPAPLEVLSDEAVLPGAVELPEPSESEPDVLPLESVPELPDVPGWAPEPDAPEPELPLEPLDVPLLDCANAVPLMPRRSAMAHSLVMCFFIYLLCYFVADGAHAPVQIPL